MGRRKLLSDDVLLDRVLAAIEAGGPANLTFAKAAEAAGLSPATLVQRFGTRDAMIETVLLHAWDKLDAALATADAAAPLGPAGAIEILTGFFPGDAATQDIADGLLLMREDLRNPALRARGAAWGGVLAAALGRRLVGDSEDVLRFGWQMARIWQGEVVWWAFRRQDEPALAIRKALEDWCRSVGVVLR